MALIFHALGYIPNRLTLVQNNRQNISGKHGVQLQLGLYKIVRANDPSEVQFGLRLRLNREFLVITVICCKPKFTFKLFSPQRVATFFSWTTKVDPSHEKGAC